MAEGLLRHDHGERFEVESAGTNPGFVRPEAITVMREVGVDISGHRSKHVEEFGAQQFDYVITVCDNARETCPVYFGKAQKLHHDFEDPAALTGSEEQRLALIRRVRDELRSYLRRFALYDLNGFRRNVWSCDKEMTARGSETPLSQNLGDRERRRIPDGDIGYKLAKILI